jgi:hypothetical protein
MKDTVEAAAHLLMASFIVSAVADLGMNEAKHLQYWALAAGAPWSSPDSGFIKLDNRSLSCGESAHQC